MAHSNRSTSLKSTPLAFFGTAEFSVPCLQALLGEGYDIAVVITKPDTARGRGRQIRPPLVKTIAESYSIPLLQPGGSDELTAMLRPFKHVTRGVVVAYGMILPTAVLAHFQDGLVNVHASLLPRWRGPSPIEAAILGGDRQIGISLMRLEAKMDSGPVYGFAQLPAPPDLARPAAYQLLAELGADSLVALLPDIINSKAQPVPQDHAAATYTKLLHKADGVIDWQQPAEQIERQVRAYLGWPGSFTTLRGKDVALIATRVLQGRALQTRAHQPGNVFTIAGGQLVVACGRGALIIDRLKPAGKSEMSGAAFLAGLPAPPTQQY